MTYFVIIMIIQVKLLVVNIGVSWYRISADVEDNKISDIGFLFWKLIFNQTYSEKMSFIMYLKYENSVKIGFTIN